MLFIEREFGRNDATVWINGEDLAMRLINAVLHLLAAHTHDHSKPVFAFSGIKARAVVLKKWDRQIDRQTFPNA